MNWERLGIDVSKVRGTQGKVICPKCSHERRNKTEPCLSVNLEDGLFNCHHCGWSGTAKEYAPPPKVYERPAPRLTKVGPKAERFFFSRGISNNTLLRFGITECMEYMPQFRTETAQICFNYYRNGELINIKFRGPEKAFKMQSGAELIFYNLDAIAEGDTVTIVEGEMDCLSMYEAGVHDCVSVPNGASKGNQRLEYLDNCWRYFEGKTRIVIATDNDAPGIALRDELARRIGRERCWFVNYPEGCKDANDVLIKHGKEAVKELISKAFQPPIEGVATFEDYAAEIATLYQDGFPPGQSAGLPGFDELLNFGPGQLTIITGAPGSGKDEFTNTIVSRLALRYHARTAILSMEETTAITFAKLIEKVGGKGFHKFTKPDKRLQVDEMLNASDFVKDHFYILKNDEVELTVDAIVGKLTAMVLRYGIQYVVISPWNCLEHSYSRGQSETQYISIALSKITQFAAKTGVHVFLLAHPVKLQKQQDGSYPVPTLYDISGSAHFFNKTHNGFGISRDYNTGRVQVKVYKVKQFWHGKPGECFFSFDKETRQYLADEPDAPAKTAFQL